MSLFNERIEKQGRTVNQFSRRIDRESQNAPYRFPYERKRLHSDLDRDFRKTYARHVGKAEKTR